MPIPDRIRLPSAQPEFEWLLTDDGSRTLWDSRLNETYHSGCGAVAESLVVYLRNSGVEHLLRERSGLGKPSSETDRDRSTAGVSILEFGFGTGTAFLLTAACAISVGSSLHYRGLELNLLPAELLSELGLGSCQLTSDYQALYGELLPIAEELMPALIGFRQQLASPEPGQYMFCPRPNITLELWMGDASLYQATDTDHFDAIYFDPFSPATSPQLWTSSVFQQAYASLRSGGTLTSYCVKSDVRRRLSDVGFQVAKIAGPTGGKREVLLARKPL